MQPGGRTRQDVLLTAASVAWALAALGLKVQSASHSPLDVAADALAGGLFLVAGMLARSWGEHRRFGGLLICASFAWFGEDFITATATAPYSLGVLLSAASGPLLAHLVLAFPTGRLRGRVDRATVAVAYVAALGLQPLRDALTGPSPGCGCPRSWWTSLVGVHPTGAHALESVLGGLGLAIAAAVVGILVARRRRASPLARRAAAPFLLVGIFLGATAAGDVFARLLLGHGESPVLRVFGALQVVGLCALPVAFLAGLLRMRLLRADVSETGLRTSASAPPVGMELARRLGDPGFAILRSDPGGGWTDEAGCAVELPAPSSDRAVTFVAAEMALLHDPSLTADPDLWRTVQAVASRAPARDREAALPPARPTLAGLTPRELEVLALMAEGCSNAAIVERLVISPKTLERHVGAILVKLGLPPTVHEHRRVRAVLAYLAQVGEPTSPAP